MNETHNVEKLDARLQALFGRRQFGIKLGLDLEQALLEELGNPQRSYGIVHVAGTNGKGSVCAFLAAMLKARGFRVGMYSSPHLVRFNERFRVDGAAVEDDELPDLLNAVDAAAAAVQRQTGREATFFEYGTALAFEYFRRREVHLAVIETGLGGRLDATNVVTPLVSVITRIALDHAQYLGTTLEAIAAEKGGIIKPGRPVVCGAMPEEAGIVLRRIAKEQGCVCKDAPQSVSCRVADEGIAVGGLKLVVESQEMSYGTVTVPLLGLYQAENAATAVAAVETVYDVLGLEGDWDSVRRGLETVVWSGRCQILKTDPPVLLDGAHNPDAARALGETLRRLASRRPIGLIVGMCGDKDVAGFLRLLLPHAARCWTVPIEEPRSIDPAELARIASERGLPVAVSTPAEALAAAQDWARAEDGLVCVAGSLFLVGQVLRESHR